jgi:hypothetical protein
MTIASQLIAALETAGYKEIDTRSSKYKAFEKPGISQRLFVGKSGALRIGRSSSQSRSLTGTTYYRMLLGRE